MQKSACQTQENVCVVAQVGDTDNPATVGGKSWLAHFNVRYANPVLMAIEPNNWSVCVLHLHLRLVSALLSYTVFHRLTEYDKKWRKNRKADDRDDSDSICHKMFELLRICGIRVRQVSIAEKSVGAKFYQSVTKHSFMGNEADAMLVIWPLVLDLVFPEEERRKSRSTQQSFENAQAAWRQYAEILWPLIRTPAVGKEAREAKAAKVEEEALVFVEKYVAANKATTHLYMHILTSHLPQMIRDLPVDPALFSTSGLEHGHKQRKAFAALMCNLLGPHVEGTTKNVSSYTRQGTESTPGELVAGYCQQQDFGALHQLLRLELVQNTMFKHFEDSDGHLQSMELARRQQHTAAAARRYRLRQHVKEMHGSQRLFPLNPAIQNQTIPDSD